MSASVRQSRARKRPGDVGASRGMAHKETQPPVSILDDTEFLVCRVPRELAEKYADWTEVAAFRLVREGEDEVRLEVTRDLELVTRPA